MKIVRLRIDDFGIIRNQTMENISPGMVVIGGPNRAGKTTFLKLLRCLGYGLKGQGKIPPATSKYRFEGDLMLEEGDLYQVYIEGLSEPRVSCIKGDESKVKSSNCLYNNLDVFTYQQLFTISLEELRRIPESIEKKEEEKLQSVLLGAGLKDIMEIAPVEQELRKEADKIGGKNGKPNVKRFGEIYPEIKAGIDLKDEAKSQVTVYYDKKAEKDRLEGELKEIKKELESLDLKIIRLDTLKTFHQGFYRIVELQNILADPKVKEILDNEPIVSKERINQLIEDYEKAYKTSEEQQEIFKNKVNLNALDEIKTAKEILGEKHNNLENYHRHASGIREKLQSYNRNEKELQETENKLQLEAEEIKAGLGDELEDIRRIKTDQLSYDNLSKCVEDFQEISQRKNNAAEEKEKLEQELKHLNDQLNEIETTGLQEGLNKYYKYALVFLILGGLTGIANLIFGIMVGTVGAIGLGLYVLIRNQAKTQDKMRRDNLNSEINRIEGLLEVEKEKEAKAYEKLKKIQKELDDYKEALGLADDITPRGIMDLFHRISSLKEKIETMNLTEEKLMETKTELKTELENLYDLLETINQEVYAQRLAARTGIEKDEVLSQGDNLLAELNQMIEWAVEAKELSRCEQMLNNVVERIGQALHINTDEYSDLITCLEQERRRREEYEKYKSLQEEYKSLKDNLLANLKMDRIKTAFKIDVTEEDAILDLFKNYWNDYASTQDVEKDYQEIKKRYDDLKQELEVKGKSIPKLELELDELKTDENLKQAQAKIDKNRSKIRPLAEKYAVQKGAALLLNEVRGRFLQDTKDTLLKEADDYLSKITGGEYQGIMPTEDLTQADFRVKKEGGDQVDTSEVLSRGTKEQLFLAVRLSRIKDIQPPLPIILDDTLTNFDMYHLDRTVSILAELSRTHQVFVLTCHPELIRAIMEHTSNDNNNQFIKLKDGKFSEVNSNMLIDFLSR